MKLEDFPEYKATAEKLRDLEAQQRQGDERKAAIQNEAIEASPSARIAFGETWRTEFAVIERQEPLLAHQIATARAEHDRVHGKYSAEICRMEMRPQVIEATREQIRALKALCRANEKIIAIRAATERNNVRTDSIANTVFDLGIWDDQFGGRIVAHRRFVAENFPELRKETD